MNSNASSPLKVLQLISSLQVGGAEVMLLSFMEAAKNHPALSLSAVVLNEEYHDGLRQRLESIGWPVSFFQRKMGDKHPKHILRLVKEIDSKQIQIIHAHDPGAKMAALICKMLRPHLKVTFTVHDTHIIAELSKPKLLLHRYAIDGHVAISGAVEQECHDYGVSNVRKIYNGVDLSQFSPKIQVLKSFDKQPLKLVQVARFELYKKGQDVLLKALKICIDQGVQVHLSFVGMVPENLDDPKEQFEKLKGIISDLGLENHVSLLVNRTDVPAILQQHDAFVLPSRKEGFGLVVIEAMASGLPVIASNLDGPAELIQSGENGLLFQSENYQELAQQILKLTQLNSLELERLAKAGLQTAQRFSIQQMVNGYMSYYQALLNPPVIHSLSSKEQQVIQL